jgi:hypothetical protein
MNRNEWTSLPHDTVHSKLGAMNTRAAFPGVTMSMPMEML